MIHVIEIKKYMEKESEKQTEEEKEMEKEAEKEKYKCRERYDLLPRVVVLQSQRLEVETEEECVSLGSKMLSISSSYSIHL